MDSGNDDDEDDGDDDEDDDGDDDDDDDVARSRGWTTRRGKKGECGCSASVVQTTGRRVGTRG